MVNIVGDHATYHLEYDAPLTSDIEGIAGPVSHWVHTSGAAEEIARDTAAAISAAGRGQIATLILPADVSWGDNPHGPAAVTALAAPPAVPASRIDEAVAILQSGRNCMIIIGGREVDTQRGLMLSRIGKACGARVSTETFPTRVARGAGTADLERMPYLAELAIDHIKDLDHLILIGAKEPVSFFAYPDLPSVLAPPTCKAMELATVDDDIDAALEQLLEKLSAVDISPDVQPLLEPEMPDGDLDANTMAAILARRLPENAIVVDEGVTSSLACYGIMATAKPHDWLNNTGGSIGWGLPAAVGAAVACPERKVVCLEGDGSAMYTIQALWTMARENLDITILLFTNRKYSILELEFTRTGARGGTPGPKAASMLEIGNPDIDYVDMARSMGVEASLATSVAEFDSQLREALAAPGPRLVELILPTVF
jgi:acetolactate synthase-1/2/3 large subunit